MSKASVYFTLNKINDKHDIKAIKGALDRLPGMLSVSVSDDAKRVSVDFDTTGVQRDRIGKQLEKMGYEILASEEETHMM